jgi:hypothetical protein
LREKLSPRHENDKKRESLNRYYTFALKPLPERACAFSLLASQQQRKNTNHLCALCDSNERSEWAVKPLELFTLKTKFQTWKMENKEKGKQMKAFKTALMLAVLAGFLGGFIFAPNPPYGQNKSITESISWGCSAFAQDGIPGVRLVGGFLSVDVKNESLLRLFEDLGKKCDIDISGKQVLSNKNISTKFQNMSLEQGIKRLIWTARIENYALTYRKDSGGKYIVSQIFFLPGGVEPSKPYHMAERTKRASLEPRPVVEPETPTERKGRKLTKPVSKPETHFQSIPKASIPKRFMGLEIKYPDSDT